MKELDQTHSLDTAKLLGMETLLKLEAFLDVK